MVSFLQDRILQDEDNKYCFRSICIYFDFNNYFICLCIFGEREKG